MLDGALRVNGPPTGGEEEEILFPQELQNKSASWTVFPHIVQYAMWSEHQAAFKSFGHWFAMASEGKILPGSLILIVYLRALR